MTVEMLSPIFPELIEAHKVSLSRSNTNILEAHRLPQGTISCIINGFIRDEIKSVFQGRQGIRIDEKNQGFDFWVSNILCIHFNKFNEYLVPTRNKTSRRVKFDNQMLIEDDIPLLRKIMPEEEIIAPNFANLYIGYHLDETASLFSRLFVTHPISERRYRWAHCFYDYNLESITSESVVIEIKPKTVPPQTESDVDLKDELKPKHTKEKDDEEDS
jgi:hypothetical protein